MSQQAPILLQLFGQPELRGFTGRVITRFAGGKSLHLLAILALSPNQDFQRVDLVAELWPGVSHEDGRNRLNVALHHVRKSLVVLIGSRADRALVTSRGCIKLEAGMIEVDLLRFEVTAQQLLLKPHEYVNASQVGALLEQAHEGVMLGYSDQWAASRATRIVALVDRLRSLVKQGDVNPQAHSAGTLLSRGETFASKALMTGDFIDAGSLLTDIVGWVTSGQTRVLGVHGPAGVGKSRAVKVALDAQTKFRVLTIACDGLIDEAMLAAAVALALDTPVPGTLSGLNIGNAATSPGSKPLLFHFDNADQVIGHVGTFSLRLIGNGASARVIVTSREAITGNQITNVRVYPLTINGTTAGPDGYRLSPALQLFETAAHRVAPGFDISPNSLNAVERLCMFADGIPLAIELMAGKVQLHTPEMLVELLETEGLGSRDASDVASHTSAMESLLSWSIQNLPASAQRFLLQCTVFPSTFDVEAATFVTGRGDAPKILQDLVNASLVFLVQKETLFDGLRFRLLESVRRQCRLILEPAAQQSVLTKHAEYFVLVADSIPPAGIGRADFIRLNRFRLEDDNFELAIQTLQAKDPAAAANLILTISPLWLQTHAHQLRGYLSQLLDDQGVLTGQQQVWVYVYGAAEAESRFDYETASRYHQQVHTRVGMARKAHWLSSPLMVEILLRDPAMSQWLQGLIASWPEPMTKAVILRHNALHAWYAGDLPRAGQLIDDALRLAQDSTPAVVRDTHFIKAQFCLWTLETVAARDALEAINRFYTSSGLVNSDYYVWQSLALLASTLITTGQYEEARDTAMRAWEAIERLPPGPGMAAPLLALATTEAILGNHVASDHWSQTLRQRHSDFLRTSTAERAHWNLTDSHPVFAEIALAKGNHNEAIALAASGWRHFSSVQPLTPGPQMMGYIAARCILSKAEHSCGLTNAAVAGIALTLPLRKMYGVFRDVLSDLDIVAAFAHESGDLMVAARLYGGTHALRLRSLHVARPYTQELHGEPMTSARKAYPIEWSKGTTLTLVQMIDEATDYVADRS